MPVVGHGAVGTLLVEYHASCSVLPPERGWSVQGYCLNAGCPDYAGPGDPCFYQGARDLSPVDGVPDNNCTLGTGCRTQAEQLVAPPQAVQADKCTYTEWLAFDDGDDHLNEAYPVPLPARNLTLPDALWGAHVVPAFGAPGFAHPPACVPLRISTGSGVPGTAVLPVSSGNRRNNGRAALTGVFTIPPGASSVTLLARMAAGNREPSSELVQFRAFNKCLSVGVNGLDGDARLGQFYYSFSSSAGDQSAAPGLFGSRTVQVALARPYTPGPQPGEFFTVRIALESTGAYSAWLNDDPSSLAVATASSKTSAAMVMVTPDATAATAWLEFIEVMEGAVPPGTCGDRRFDTNGDARIDAADLSNGVDGFLECATGPAALPAVLDGLPASCRCRDVNSDGAVDMEDFGVFQSCLSEGADPQGGWRLSDPACDDE